MTGFVSSDPLNNLTSLYDRPIFISAQRIPTANDLQNPGTQWQNNAVSPPLIYETTGQGRWNLSGSSTSALNTLTGDTGTATPVANNIQIAGTANQITTAASGAVVTLTIPAVFIAPGSIASTTTLTAGSSLAVTTNATVGGTLSVTGTTTLAAVNATNGTFSGTLGVTGLSTLGATTIVGTTNINASGAAVTTIGTGGTGAVNIGNATGNTAVTGTLTSTAGITASTGNIVATAGAVNAGTSMTATLGAITATNGNLVLGTAGNKLVIPTGANASTGTSGAMTAGAVTVATTAVSATSFIVAYPAALGTVTVPQAYYISAIVAATSFTITSQDATDTSTWRWWLIN